VSVPVHASAAVRIVPSPPKHYKHVRFVCRRFRKRPLNLVRLPTPRSAIDRACAFKDVEHAHTIRNNKLTPTTQRHIFCCIESPANHCFSQNISDESFVFAIELNRVVSFARQSSDSCGERLALGRNHAFVIVRIETEETSASKARRLSPQCLCSSPQEYCREAFFYFTAQSKARSAEAVRVCGDDRNSCRSSIRKSQKRLQISLGRPKTWSETNARTLRASEPDAV